MATTIETADAKFSTATLTTTTGADRLGAYVIVNGEADMWAPDADKHEVSFDTGSSVVAIEGTRDELVAFFFKAMSAAMDLPKGGEL